MSDSSTDLRDYDAIARAVHYYIDGLISGRGDDMKPGFHRDATIYGNPGGELFSGPIQLLFDLTDKNGAASELQARIAGIDLNGTVATARLELNNWAGARYTDLFTLLKTDGEWKIINKVFHLHA